MTNTAPNVDEDQADNGAIDEIDAAALVAQLAQLAAATIDGQPVAIAEGRFAAYPMPDGGIMFVTAVDTGPMAGIKHSRITPGLIRAFGTLGVIASGGSKLKALRGLVGRRKEIEGAPG